MKIRFTKMQGLGNDFVVLDAIHQSFIPTPAQVRFLADRHFGVGCDQVLVVEEPTRPDTDFRYRIFNADGSEVEQCGNGARCFARFVHDKGLSEKRTIRVETARAIIAPQLEDDGTVSVDMGVPRFAPDEIPFVADHDAPVHELTAGDSRHEISVVSMGNPHCVLFVDDVAAAKVSAIGTAIEGHPRFPARINVGFAQIIDRQWIRLRVWERGTGETLACGSGACAAAVAGMRRGLLQTPVRVAMPGGELTVSWAGAGQPVIMRGPAGTVFEGEIDVPMEDRI